MLLHHVTSICFLHLAVLSFYRQISHSLKSREEFSLWPLQAETHTFPHQTILPSFPLFLNSLQNTMNKRKASRHLAGEPRSFFIFILFFEVFLQI